MCEIVAARGRDAATDVAHRLAALAPHDGPPAAVAELAGERTLGAPRSVRPDAVSRHPSARDESPGRLAIGQRLCAEHQPAQGAQPADAAGPSADCEGTVMVAQCGTLDNGAAARGALEAAGHRFASDRDGEIIAHAIEDALGGGAEPFDAFQAALRQLTGTWAVTALIARRNSLFVAQHGSRLAVRGTVGRCVVATDPAATAGVRGPLRILEDGSIAELGTMWHWVSASGRPPAPAGHDRA